MSPFTESLNLFNRPNYFELSGTLKMEFSDDRFGVEEHCGHFNVLCIIDLRHINNTRIRQNNVEYIDQISCLSLQTSASLCRHRGDLFCREITHSVEPFPVLNPCFCCAFGLCYSLIVTQHLQSVF